VQGRLIDLYVHVCAIECLLQFKQASRTVAKARGDEQSLYGSVLYIIAAPNKILIASAPDP